MNRQHIELLTSAGWREYLELDVLPWIRSEVDAAGLGDLLEVGPGPGSMTDLLRPCAASHAAIEIDPELAASLRDRSTEAGIEVICADASDTDLEDGRFTTVVCLTMIHHVPSTERQDRLFTELHRLLSPGGRLIGLDSLDSPALRSFHIDDTFVPLEVPTLAARLGRAGFVDPHIEIWDPPRRPGAKVRFTAMKAAVA